MTQVIIGREVFLAGYRLTSQLRSHAESFSTAELDATVYSDDATMINEPGLKGYGISGEGFWDATGIDVPIEDRIRTRNVVHTLCLADGSVGSRAASLQAMIGEYEIGGSMGELFSVSYALGNMGSPLRGQILHNASATGNVTGTAVQVGAVTATQSVYAAFHVFSGTGELVVKVQSASDEAFTSPNDRITFATVLTGTAQASEWSTAAGAITDTWWRVTATNPNTRDFAAVIGIH